MPDTTTERASLGAVVARMRSALADVIPVREELSRAVDAALAGAERSDNYEAARQSLGSVVEALDEVADAVRAEVARVDVLRREWEAANRYAKGGLDALARELAALAARPHTAARRWVDELLDAIRASELEAAVEIADFDVGFGDGLGAGREVIREHIRRLRDGDAARGLELTEALARGELPGWERVLGPELRARAHRLAAFFALRTVNDVERARGHVEAAVEVEPRNGVNYAERASLALFVGDLDRGAADAEQAIELAPDDPAGFLALGLWSELTGEFDDAERSYRDAHARMTTHALAAIARRSSLLEPSGLMLVVAAERLLDAGQPDAALEVASTATATGVRGRAAHPDARAHRVRRHALGDVPGRAPEAAAAAVEAGKRYLWNGDLAAAVDELRAALELEADVPDARWFLAEALVQSSFPIGTAAPDADLIDKALRVWDEARRIFGPPADADSWAYLTRALAFSLRPGDPPTRRVDRWTAVVDVERSLVHAPWDGRRWGFAARFLRAVGLDECAFEAVERGYELDASDDVVFEERVALLANRGRFGEAADNAAQLVASYGDNPWVAGVRAWLAQHQGRYEEAITLLELPLSGGYDLTWYYDLRALCHVALGDVDAARADYAAIVSGAGSGAIPVSDALAEGTIAVAEAVAGDVARARRWLDEGPQHEPTATDDLSLAAVQALVALATGDTERAGRFLRQAVESTRGVRDVDDLVANFPRRVETLRLDDEQRERRATLLREELEEPARRRRRELASVEPATPDDELRAALARREPTDRVAEIALLAIAARRHVEGGDDEGAVAAHERLRSSDFEPEASIALTRALRSLSDRAAAAGDVETTRRAQERLIAIGHADEVDAARAVAAALRAGGDHSGARDTLVRVSARARETGRGDLVEQAIGELFLAQQDGRRALASFEAAIELLERRDGARLAQLETRTALAHLATGEPRAAERDLVEAVAAWRSAGALEPLSATVHEARAAAYAAADSQAALEAVDALTKMVETLRSSTLGDESNAGV